MFTLACGIERFDVYGAEHNTGNVEAVQPLCQFLRLYPCSREHLERNGIAYADRHVLQFSQNAAHGIEECGVRVGDMR